MPIRRPRTTYSRVSTNGTTSRAGALAYSSLIANSPTTGSTADLPWWLQAGIGIAGGVLGGQSLGEAGSGYLCQAFGICPPQSQPSRPGLTGSNGNGCPSGAIKVGERCVFPGDIFPGGDPFITGAGGVPVEGAFGMPARTPVQMQQTIRRCGPGMVLGADELCYPKSSIHVRDRKWRPKPKPPVTAGDQKAINRASSAKKRVARLAKKTGLYVRERPPPRQQRTPPPATHRHLLPGASTSGQV